MLQFGCGFPVSNANQTPDSNRIGFSKIRSGNGIPKYDDSRARVCDQFTHVKVSSLPPKSFTCSIGQRHLEEVLSVKPLSCNDNKVGKFGVESPKHTEEVFELSPDDSSHWTAKVPEEVLDSACSQCKGTHSPFASNTEDDLLRVKVLTSLENDVATYASHLRHCGNVKVLDNGKCVHTDIISHGYDHNTLLGNLLVEMYGNCGSLLDAHCTFAKLSYPNLYSWTLLIKACTENGNEEVALDLFSEMQTIGVKPDKIAFISILGACAHLTALAEGWNFHATIVRCGFDSDVAIGNSLINLYSKCGSLDGARNAFNKIEQRSLISWSAMITACVLNGQSQDAFDYFKHMQDEGIKPDKITFTAILNACADLSAREEGHGIHAKIVDGGLESDVTIGNALINMYAKCGDLDSARTVFDKMQCRNVISWTAIIAACAQHGHSSDALELFSQMMAERVTPDEITYVGVLTACSHMGLVDVGKGYFTSMLSDYRLTPLLEHYVCMIDLLGRTGQLDEAEDLLKNMPFECASAWLSLLSMCRIHGDVERGARAAANALKLDPANASPFSHLLNIHAAAGRWDSFEEVRRARAKSGVRKVDHLCSNYDTYKRVHKHLADGKSCYQEKYTCAKLRGQEVIELCA